MITLAAQQRALLRALWLPHYETAMTLAGPHLAKADAKALRGLRAYRSHGRALAERALAAAYPRVREQLGDDNFGGLARAHWLRHPPARGDVAWWGGELARHIESLPQLAQDEPGLADLARLDWALHRAATAADASPRLESLRWLTECDPARVALRLAPATACVAGQLVWRQGLAPRCRPLAAGEAEFIEALLAGRPLDAALASNPIDFGTWLAAAAREGLVLGVRRLRRCQENRS
jgi:hypothetical protein